MTTYVDTSVILKLLVNDEVGGDAADLLWTASGHIVCAEIGYAEGRAALAAAHRNSRLSASSFRTAKREFERLWSQIDVVKISTAVVRSAGNLAESGGLRGYDAVHLAAGIAATARVFASADSRLLEAARREGFATSNPLQAPT